MLGASLTGEQANPPVNTDLKGVAGIIMDANLDSVCIYVVANELTGPVTQILILKGSPGPGEMVVFDLTPYNQHREVAVRMGITKEQAISFINGEYYVVIKTAAVPSGEIAGRVLLETDLHYTGVLGDTSAAYGFTTLM